LSFEGCDYVAKGKGSSKKLAKTNAAQKFCQFLITTCRVTEEEIWVKENLII